MMKIPAAGELQLGLEELLLLSTTVANTPTASTALAVARAEEKGNAEQPVHIWYGFNIYFPKQPSLPSLIIKFVFDVMISQGHNCFITLHSIFQQEGC